jgi:hypothetical protein
MSGDNTASKNYHRRLAAEYAELDHPRVTAQMATRCALAAPAGPTSPRPSS